MKMIIKLNFYFKFKINHVHRFLMYKLLILHMVVNIFVH